MTTLNRKPNFTSFAVALAAVSALAVSNAQATTIGPGEAQPVNQFDSSLAQLTTVTYQTGVSLGPGKYAVSDFGVNYEYSGAGTVVPFLAVLTNNDPTFTTVWVGPNLAGVSAGGIQTVNYAAGTEQFTLASTANLYAGTWQTGGVFVGSQSFVSGGDVTAADITFGHPGAAPSVMTGFTYPNVSIVAPRTYAYQIDVTPVPEPASFVLFGVGAAGLLIAAARRRLRPAGNVCRALDI